MASVAATAIFSLPGVTPPGVKTANTDGVTTGDSFADMLAAVDAAMLVEGQAMPPAPMGETPPQALPAEDAATDTDMETAEIPAAAPQLLAAIPQAAAKPQVQMTAGKDAGKDVKAKDEPKPDQPANDNMNAAPAPQPPVPMPMQVPVQAAAPQPVTSTPQEDKSAPLAALDAPQEAANAGAAMPQAPVPASQQQQQAQAPAANGSTVASPAPVQAPPQQQAANDADAEENSEAAAAAAAPQTAKLAAKDTAPKPAAARPAKPTEFKKAVDNDKPATRPDAAPAADSSKDIRQADARPPQPAEARRGYAPTQPAPHPAGAQPQQDIALPVNAAAPAQPASPAPAAATPQAAPVPLPHHAPNLETLAVNIAAKSQGGAKQFDIRLDPPELGRVEVRLSIDANGKAEAHLSADQQQTLDLLQKDAPALTRALREAGLDVNQDGLNFSLRHQQSHASQDQPQNGRGGRAWRGSAPTQAVTETANAASAYMARGLGILDIKV